VLHDIPAEPFTRLHPKFCSCSRLLCQTRTRKDFRDTVTELVSLSGHISTQE